MYLIDAMVRPPPILKWIGRREYDSKISQLRSGGMYSTIAERPLVVTISSYRFDGPGRTTVCRQNGSVMSIADAVRQGQMCRGRAMRRRAVDSWYRHILSLVDRVPAR
jgi:hypothetical protein